jgi:hypothetical protein
MEHIAGWSQDGLSFMIHDPDQLVEMLLPLFFGATKYRSFQRQLSLWCFDRIVVGYNKKSVMLKHPYFIKGKKSICEHLGRESFKRSSMTTTRLLPEDVCSVSHVEKSSSQKIKETKTVRTVSATLSEHTFPIESSCYANACDDNSNINTDISVTTQFEDIQNGDLVEFEGKCFHFVDLEGLL